MKITLEDVQGRYPFNQPLSYYRMGVNGKPEAKEQKAFIQCLQAEFPQELGWNESTEIYHALVVAVADFYDHGKVKQMMRFRKMGYQRATPDIVILHSNHRFNGFVCEMKSLTGCPSKEQLVTLAHLV